MNRQKKDSTNLAELAKLSAQITSFQIGTGDGIIALKNHVVKNWTIREILLFKDFTHGGAYDAGKGWRINFAGYVADTADGQRNLIRLFNELIIVLAFTMGALAIDEVPVGGRFDLVGLLDLALKKYGRSTIYSLQSHESTATEGGAK